MNIIDSVDPVASCTDVTLQLDASGNAVLTSADVDPDGNSTDNCGAVTYSFSQENFSCADIGPNSVTVTITDQNGNTSTCTSTVTIEDNLGPVMENCGTTINLVLDGTGQATLTAADMGMVTDNCDPNPSVMFFGQQSFNCSSVGNPVSVLAIATDNNGNSSTCSVTVTVSDQDGPEITTADMGLDLDDSGNASISFADVASTTDNCSVVSESLSQTSFDCSNVGPNTITVTATDVNGNTSTETITVTVNDITRPTLAECETTVTVMLDELSGTATLANSDLNASDVCDSNPLIQFNVDNTLVTSIDFDCDDVGTQQVEVQVRDASDNVRVCNITVDVQTSAACTPPPTGQGDASNAMNTTEDQESIEVSEEAAETLHSELEEVLGSVTIKGARAFPNPVRSVTNIEYRLSVPAEVNIYVLDLNGQLVAQVDRGLRNSGTNRVRWTPASGLPSAMYYIVVEAENAERQIVRVQLQR